MSGSVEKIFLIPNKKGAAQEVTNAVLEADKGIVGDRYHAVSSAAIAAGNKPKENHISLISQEELDTFLQNNESEIAYGDFRRNLITSNINLNSLVGKEFSIGSARCRGMELCEPCAFLAATVHSAVLPELVHKGGLRAVIINDGQVEAGSEITF